MGVASLHAPSRRDIADLQTLSTIRLGAKADWVAVTDDSVWVGSTGPNAVHQIDAATGQVVAVVDVPGEPCAGLATGFGSLWVPLCAKRPAVARVDLLKRQLTGVFPVNLVTAEAGVTTGSGNVWLMTDHAGTLTGLNPLTGSVRRTLQVPAGSYNPLFSGGLIWVTRAAGATVTAVDPVAGDPVVSIDTGPEPRFLAAGYGAIWTLNQGDGTLSRIDARSKLLTATVQLDTPGPGGDIAVGGGMVWTTVRGVPLSAVDAYTAKVRCQWFGNGGDSVGVAHGSIWLINCRAGEISRIGLQAVLSQCGA
jgi:streptogramin lyase